MSRKAAPKKTAKKPETAPAPTAPLLFKVLVNGRSCHGGALDWSLPAEKGGKWTPGAWHEIDGAPEACTRGFHLTDDPAAWWLDNCTVFVAEGSGDTAIGGDAPHKIAFQRARLVRPATQAELEAAQIFDSGAHEIKRGCAVARGSSSVVAWGSSSVVAWGSSSVVAWGSSSVVARGSSSVEAWGSSSVVARGSSSVEAWGSSSVVAWESSSVVAWGSSSVVAWGSSSVEARESSSVVAWGSSSVVARGSSSVEARESSSVVAKENATVNIANWYASKPSVTSEGAAVVIDRRVTPPLVSLGGVKLESTK